MTQLRQRLRSEARIDFTSSDAGKKPKPAIASLTINLGNGLHMTRKLAGKPPSRLMERFFHEINTGSTDYQNLPP